MKRSSVTCLLATLAISCCGFAVMAQNAGNAATTVVQSPDGSVYVHTGNVTVNQGSAGNVSVRNTAADSISESASSHSATSRTATNTSSTTTAVHHHHHRKIASAHHHTHVAHTKSQTVQASDSALSDTATSQSIMSQTTASGVSESNTVTTTPAAPGTVVVNTTSDGTTNILSGMGPAAGTPGGVSVQTDTVHVTTR